MEWNETRLILALHLVRPLAYLRAIGPLTRLSLLFAQQDHFMTLDGDVLWAYYTVR